MPVRRAVLDKDQSWTEIDLIGPHTDGTTYHTGDICARLYLRQQHVCLRSVATLSSADCLFRAMISLLPVGYAKFSAGSS
jgi:hypothetical protein